MKKEFLLTINILSFLLVAYSLITGTPTYAYNATQNDKAGNISTQKFLRFIDTKKEYGKSCEEYNYITSSQRLKLLKQDNFMLGDILSDSLRISNVNPDHLVETNLTECNKQTMSVSEYTYREKLEYFNENIVTIEVLQYAYGAGAAHGNGHISRYMYDREYGMKLDWENLFGTSESFDLYVLQRVVKEIADEDFIGYFKASDKLLNFRKQGYFAITDKGLLIQYGKYEITPGASGLPSIVVTKEVLKQYMSREMYAKCFLSSEQVIMEVLNDF